MKEIESYCQRILRNIININWFDNVSNKNVLMERAICPPIDTIITRHVVSLDIVRLPKYSELVFDERSKGKQKKRFKDRIIIVVNNMVMGNNERSGRKYN